MKKSILFLFVTVALLNSVLASNAVVEIDVNSLYVNINEKIHLDSREEVILTLPEDYKSLSVNTEHTLLGNNLIITGQDIIVNYTSQKSIEKTKDGYYLVNKYIAFDDLSELSIVANFDEKYYLSKEDIFPKDNTIYTDGKMMSVKWTYKDVKDGEAYPIFLKFQKVGDNDDIYFYIIIGIIIVGLITYVIYRYIVKKNKRKIEPKVKKNAPSNNYEKYLLESEKKIIEELKQAEKNELWQKQLQIKSGFSKAKLSRLIRNLESRNIIKKIPLGNTNKIILKKK